MAKNNDKPYIFYPIQILSADFKWNLDKFQEGTSLDKIKANIYEANYQGEKILYSLITEKPYWKDNNGNLIPGEINSEGIIFGRLLRLRNDAITRIDLELDKLQEEILTSSNSKYLLESTYFAIDTKSNIMLGQYNKHSVNILTRRPGDILQNTLQKLNLHNKFQGTEPIPTDELIQAIIKRESLVSNFRLSFQDVDFRYLEKALGIASGQLNSLLEQNDFNLIMSFSPKHKPSLTENFFNRLSTTFHKDKKFNKLKVSTEDGVFDLFNENFLYYILHIDAPEIKDNKAYEKLRDDIQKGMLELLTKHNKEISSIRVNHHKNKHIDDF